MTRSTIPHSGDFMRLFARTPMTGAALRVANALAGHISYNGTFRGAPKGFAAFTMGELQEITALSERAVRTALDELARLFGLTVKRRHHARHLFRFSKIVADTDRGQGGRATTTDSMSPDTTTPERVTGTSEPASLYTNTTRNNDTSSSVGILDDEGSVHRTPFASVIQAAKKGTAVENVDSQFLWRGFQMLNRRNGNERVPVSWLVAFIRKAKPKYHRPAKKAEEKPQEIRPAQVDPVVLMARPAPYGNQQFHESDLRRAIGASAYEARIEAIQDRFGATRFAARLAVHGKAVEEGIIQP